MKLKRREFLAKSGSAVATAAIGGVWTSVAQAAVASGNPVTVVIFLRGAADGLSLVPPISGTNRTHYLAARPNIAIKNPLSLGATVPFGLHPNFKFLKTLWGSKELAIVHGAGSLNTTRSHFEQMDYIEWGHHSKSQATGYLNRALQEMNGTASPFILQAASLQPAFEPTVAQALRGPQPAQAVDSLEKFSKLLHPTITPTVGLVDRVEGTYMPPSGACADWGVGISSRVCASAKVDVSAIEAVNSMLPRAGNVSTKSLYGGESNFGNALREAARIISAEPRTRFLTVDYAGWDTHVDQGNDTSGALFWRIQELDNGLRGLVTDAKRLGFWNRTNIVIMTEFGRTVKENGTKGTDHGRGSAAFVLGPASKVNGGKVFAPNWSLDPKLLEENRDVFVKVDLRDIMCEVIQRHMGIGNLAKVFPDLVHRRAGILK